MLKKPIIAALALSLVMLMTACGDATPTTPATPTTGAQPTTAPTAVSRPTDAPVQATTGAAAPAAVPASPTGAVTTGASPAPAATSGTPASEGRMTIETSKGRIVLRLYTDPSAFVEKTVSNFAQKASSGYFNGLTFHRVEGWVIQGGDPQGTGSGGGDMPSEFNNLPFVAGSLGVARGPDPAINNDSQFFIVKEDSFHLNGNYTNWGVVTEGMDVVKSIAVGDKITQISVEGVTPVTSTGNGPEHISVQHVLIGFKEAAGFQGSAPPKAATRTREEARALAYDILSRAKGGEDFDALVTQYTDDSPPGIYSMANFGVAKSGADEFERGGMVPAFGNVGFNLDLNEISIADYDETTSPFGWHIIKRVK